MSNNYRYIKIYKIYSNLGDKVYIGLTTNELRERMVAHKNDYTRWIKSNKKCDRAYKLFDEYGFDNCMIELLEDKSCENKDEQSQLRGKYIREMECVNKNIPGNHNSHLGIKIYGEQYRIDNIEKIREYKKQYRLKNKDKIAEYRLKNKDFREEKAKIQTVCECGGHYRHGHKSKHHKTTKHLKYLESIIV